METHSLIDFDVKTNVFQTCRMQIFVNALFNEKKTLEVPPTDTMLDIIIKCLGESFRNNHKVQLVLGTGKPLEEGRTLAYYNIQELCLRS